MMYVHGKSRPGIVARKPANKAARSATEPSVKEPAAAESVERRPGAKGNADQHDTRRTQRRVSGSQTLERIRQMEDPPEVVIISGHGTIETAVRATKLGAFDFLRRLPLEPVVVVLIARVTIRALDDHGRPGT